MNPSTLLQRYARNRDEEAFRQIVTDYFSLVHATALRRLNGDADAAMDVAQIVFTDLARKARSVANTTHLGGWLHKHTCFVASKHVRSEARRLAREQTSLDMRAHHETTWTAMAPIIDDAVEQLSEADRQAVILRFFEGRDLRSIGEALGVSDDAAQKRVQRALEKLKTLLEARGITASVALLATLLSANAAPSIAAPTEMVAAKAMATPATAALPFKIAVASLVCVIAFLVLRPGTSSPRPSQASAEEKAAAASPTAPTTQPTAPLVEPPPANELRLQVLDAETQRPLGGALVRRVVSQLPGFGPSEADVASVTDESGIARLALPEVTPERLSLYTTRAGYGGWFSSWKKSLNETVPHEHTVFLEPATAIGGRVLDPDGKPLANAEAQINKTSRPTDVKARASHRTYIETVTNRTDATGLWEANHIPASHFESLRVNIKHEEFARTNILLLAEEIPALRQKAWTVTLQKGLSLAGRVTDTNGVAIVGAEILFSGPNDIYREQTLTDANGAYRLKHLTISTNSIGEEIVTASAPGFVTMTLAFDPRVAPRSLDFALERGFAIRGRVVDAGQQPIAGVRLTRDTGSTERKARATHATVVTDANGFFEWTSSPPTPQNFSILHPSYEQIRDKSLEPREEPHLIVLTKTRSIPGEARDAATGGLIPRVFVSPGTGDAADFPGWGTYNDFEYQTGRFDHPLGFAHYNILRLRAPGYVTAAFDIPTDGSPLIARLQPAPVVSGIIRDAQGNPVAGAEVTVSDRKRPVSVAKGRVVSYENFERDYILSDKGGRFDLPVTAPANHLIMAHPSAGVSVFDLTKFKGEAILEPWGRLEGTARPSADVRIHGARNFLLHYNQARQKADATGRFTFEFLPPDRYFVFIGQGRPGTNIVVTPGSVAYVELPE